MVPKGCWSARVQFRGNANWCRGGRRHCQGFPEAKSGNCSEWSCFEGIIHHWLPYCKTAVPKDARKIPTSKGETMKYELWNLLKVIQLKNLHEHTWLYRIHSICQAILARKLYLIARLDSLKWFSHHSMTMESSNSASSWCLWQYPVSTCCHNVKTKR